MVEKKERTWVETKKKKKSSNHPIILIVFFVWTNCKTTNYVTFVGNYIKFVDSFVCLYGSATKISHLSF